MKRSFLLICFLIICKASSFASHIVGGEFELVYLSGNTYRLNLIIYFDEINGNPGAKYDPTPVAWIYRKSDNVRIREVSLPFRSEAKVIYSLPDCQKDALVNTTRMVFSSLVTLDPNEYTSPSGYYITWQRCCRNYTIQNILSEDPDAAGVAAGQTFYLEIPPLIKNGKRFINSSPQLFPPISDYACVGRSFYADFKGSDVDGDSLVYSLVEPLNTPSAEPHPQPPSSAPYPTVQWRGSYGIDNIMHGNPDLYITDDGLLRVTPMEQGLFVFAVKCEEYRDKRKIGEVRRDFQMVVVDCVAPGEAPELSIKLEDGSTYKEGDVLEFLADDDKCVEFEVRDAKGGRVNFNLDPVGFEDENYTINITGRSPSGDQLRAKVCFNDCPPEQGLPFDIDFIGLDHTCPQPLQDTVRLTVLIEPPANELPEISHREDGSGAYSNTVSRYVEVNEQAGGMKVINILGQDADADFMDFMIEPIGFALEDYGLSIVNRRNEAGLLEAWLEWNYDCQKVSFDGKTEFEILVYVEDKDDCEYEDPVLLTLNLKVNLPFNSEPEVYGSDFALTTEYVRFTANLNNVIRFNVSALDQDGDLTVLKAVGANFNMTDYGITYAGAVGEGGTSPTQLSTEFVWDLSCDLFSFEEKDSLRIYFFAEDEDKCDITNRDTLIVDFILYPPPNSDLDLHIMAKGETVLQGGSVTTTVGESISLGLMGQDDEGDALLLRLINKDIGLNYQFNDVRAIGEVSADFTWTPVCADLMGESESQYLLEFVLADDHCYFPDADTLRVNVTIKDIYNKSDQFLPPNFFTPANGDGLNDYFGMYKKVEGTTELQNILPLDNCAGKFEEVVIFNRWGQEVFTSNDREFKWYGGAVPSGIYYYYIQYSNVRYRGSLTLMK
ncbi:T9SS type B sorting domain-containing protein [Fulvivirga sediminis]|uniref:Gliding motility-associated C-terminal domain-containing protein n=1 Tax=Fulvivirga sediminis TaxID=2803949 RepID=A0A937F4M7_9BACT|nr:gliding motility-associated C-terminal domain-containing protein [Fulvivirga sediminis]MBL3656316.1 gliding motility-associated C-terminal domain-containing protein [Fulvivirga sediminis]